MDNPHVGKIFSRRGDLLTTLVFSETCPGATWVSQQLREPLPVTAGSTYVVVMDYVTEYAGKMNYFTKPKTTGPLTIPAFGNVAGAAGFFPDQQWFAQVSRMTLPIYIPEIMNALHPRGDSCFRPMLPISHMLIVVVHRTTGLMWSSSRRTCNQPQFTSQDQDLL
jgi:hypothetical protein